MAALHVVGEGRSSGLHVGFHLRTPPVYLAIAMKSAHFTLVIVFCAKQPLPLLLFF